MKQEIIGGILLCGMGLALFFAPPEWLWELTEKWKTKDGTGPSKSYGILIKALGILFAAAGCVLAIWGAVSA
jgi:hypothetical protein